MDEVGRGPLAGNVVTACVVIPESPLIEWIDDSKKLSESRREKVYDQIMANALYVGIGQVSPEEIDRINILQATKKAMRMAADSVPTHCLQCRRGPRHLERRIRRWPFRSSPRTTSQDRRREYG